VRLTLTLMASVTTQTTALEHSTLAVFATDLVRFTPADVLTFPQAIAIVTETFSMHVVLVEAQV